MRALARFSFVHRKLVLALWLAAIGLVGGSLAVVGTAYSDAFTLPDTESSRAFSLLERVSPDSSGDVLTAVFAVEEGSLTDPAARERVEEVVAELAGLDGVVSVTSPYDAPQQVSRDGRTAFAPIQLDGIVPNDVSREQVEAVLDIAAEARGGVQVEVTGQAAAGPPGPEGEASASPPWWAWTDPPGPPPARPPPPRPATSGPCGSYRGQRAWSPRPTPPRTSRR